MSYADDDHTNDGDHDDCVDEDEHEVRVKGIEQEGDPDEMIVTMRMTAQIIMKTMLTAAVVEVVRMIKASIRPPDQSQKLRDNALASRKWT